MVHDHDCEDNAVQPVQHTPVTGYQCAGVLHVGGPLEHGLNQVAHLRHNSD